MEKLKNILHKLLFPGTAVVVLSIGCEKLLSLLMDVLERRACGCWKR